MTNMTILVTGASGQLGSRIIDHLRTRAPDARIIGLVRKEDDAKILSDRGVEARLGDYDDRASLDQAMAGVDRVVLVSSSAVGARVSQHTNVIEAAKAAGVSLLAYTSILRASENDMALAEEHKTTEAVLQASSLPHALLRNGWYTENFTGTLGQTLAMGKHFGAAGDGRFATATRDDYAAAAAAVITRDDTAGQIYELGGHPAFTLAEYAQAVTDVTGTGVSYVDMPQDDYAAALTEAGLPEGFAQILADSDAKAAKGALYTDSTALRDLIGREATPLAEAIKTAM